VKGQPPEHPALPSVEYLLFKAPLYATFALNDDLGDVKVLYNRVQDAKGHHVYTKIDGYCPYCKRDSTFKVDGISLPAGDPWTYIKARYAFDQMTITCTRNENHPIRYFFSRSDHDNHESWAVPVVSRHCNR
jgi:hypothetical protein